jgi:gag-polypeptide of LTR copia-type
MEGIMEARDYDGLINGLETRPDDGGTDSSDPSLTQVKDIQERFDSKRAKISALIVNSLGDKPLRTIQTVAKDPVEAWKKLEARYASKTTSYKLYQVMSAHSMKVARKRSMADHVGELETLFSRLNNTGATIDDKMQVAILLMSLEGHSEDEVNIAAIRTRSDDNTTWELVATRLMDEDKHRQQGNHIHKFEAGGTAAVMKGNKSNNITCNCCDLAHLIWAYSNTWAT